MTALRVHGTFARGVFAAVVLLSLVVLFLPASGVPGSPPGVDKLVHAALFAALAGTGRWAGLGAWVLGVVLLVYAASSELVQGLPALARSASIADWAADGAGVLLGLALWDLLARRRPPTR